MVIKCECGVVLFNGKFGELAHKEEIENLVGQKCPSCGRKLPKTLSLENERLVLPFHPTNPATFDNRSKRYGQSPEPITKPLYAVSCKVGEKFKLDRLKTRLIWKRKSLKEGSKRVGKS